MTALPPKPDIDGDRHAAPTKARGASAIAPHPGGLRRCRTLAWAGRAAAIAPTRSRQPRSRSRRAVIGAMKRGQLRHATLHLGNITGPAGRLASLVDLCFDDDKLCGRHRALLVEHQLIRKW